MVFKSPLAWRWVTKSCHKYQWYVKYLFHKKTEIMGLSLYWVSVVIVKNISRDIRTCHLGDAYTSLNLCKGFPKHNIRFTILNSNYTRFRNKMHLFISPLSILAVISASCLLLLFKSITRYLLKSIDLFYFCAIYFYINVCVFCSYRKYLSFMFINLKITRRQYIFPYV